MSHNNVPKFRPLPPKREGNSNSRELTQMPSCPLRTPLQCGSSRPSGASRSSGPRPAPSSSSLPRRPSGGRAPRAERAVPSTSPDPSDCSAKLKNEMNCFKKRNRKRAGYLEDDLLVAALDVISKDVSEHQGPLAFGQRFGRLLQETRLQKQRHNIQLIIANAPIKPFQR